MARLGKNQLSVLEVLAKRPFPNHGWIWGNYSTSKRLLDSLVKLGLASYVVTVEAGHRADTPGGLVYYHPKVERWSITPAGLAALGTAVRCCNCAMQLGYPGYGCDVPPGTLHASTCPLFLSDT